MQQQQQQQLGGGPPEAADGGLVFTDISEFARTIRVKEEGEEQATDEEEAAAGTSAAPKKEEVGLEDMDTAGPSGTGGGGDLWAGWAPATAAGETTAADMKQRIRAKQQQEEAVRQEAEQRGGGGHSGGGGGSVKSAVESESGIAEKTIGSGLAGALAFLKERGELSQAEEWAGRNNDSKKVNVSAGRAGGCGGGWW